MARLNDLVGVVGSGRMGPGIALRTAASKKRVILLGRSKRGLARASEEIECTLSESVDRRMRTAGDAAEIRGLIELTTNMGDLGRCGLVIEAIQEKLDVKRELFAELERIVSPEGILASCTSSLRIERIAQEARHPERIVGMHFFFPPAKNRLVEIVASRLTSGHVLVEADRFARECGLEPIGATDSPGFVVNRFFVPWLNENGRLLGEGMGNCATIDAANRKLLGSRLGPFELMNLNGVPLAAHSMEGLAAELGPFYAPCRTIMERAESNLPWDISGEVVLDEFPNIQRRIVGILILVARAQLHRGIAEVEDIDRGARIGLRWHSGPFGIASDWGELDSSVSADTILRERAPHTP